MIKRIAKHLFVLFVLVFTVSSCYKNEIAELHNQLDKLEFNSLVDQINAMKASVADLQELEKQLEPAVQSLEQAKIKLQENIDNLKKEMEGKIDTDKKAIQDKIDVLQGEIDLLDSALEAIDGDGIKARITELEALMTALQEKDIDGRLGTLETAAKSFATLDQLSAVSTKIDAARRIIDGLSSELSEVYERLADDINAAIEANKDNIITWVSTSESITGMFDDYYTKGEIDAKLALINLTDSTQNSQIEELQIKAAGVDDKIKNYITQVIEGEGGIRAQFTQKAAEVSGEVATLRTDLLAIIGDLNDLLTDVKSNLVAAINELVTKFASDTTEVGKILRGIRADIAALQAADEAIKGGSTTATLKSLSEAVNNLNEKVNSKADTTALNAEMAKLQENISKLITSKRVDELLESYLKTADAETLYAKAKDLSDFITAYNIFIGEEGVKDEKTVLGKLAILNGKVGSGSFTDNWTTDLTSAVNSLYQSLNNLSASVSQKIDSTKADAISKGLITALVEEIIGEGKSAKDIADLLKKFSSDVDKFSKQIGDTSKFEGKDISTAVAAIQATLKTLSDKNHKHTSADITDLTAGVENIVGKIEDIVGELEATNLVDAINKLYAKFSKYYDTTQTYSKEAYNKLLSGLESTLASAVAFGDDGQFKDLNLTALLGAINDITKENDGTIDSRIAAAILSLGNVVQQDSLAFYAGLDAFTKLQELVGTDDGKGNVISRIAAFEALQVTLNCAGKDSTINSWDKAVQYIYEKLGARLQDIEVDTTEYHKLLERCTALENIVGKGFNGKTLTDTISSISERLGTFGDNTSIATLIENLQQANTDLIDAILEGDDDKFKTLNLKQLDKDIKEISDSLTINGITDSEGKAAKGLKEILTIIDKRLDAIEGIIGTGFNSTDNTVAKAIQKVQDQLDALDKIYATDTAMANRVKEVKDNIAATQQAIIDAVLGKAAGDGEMGDFETLNLKALKERLDNITLGTKQGLEAVLDSLNSRADALQKQIGENNAFDDGTIRGDIAFIRNMLTGDQLAKLVSESFQKQIDDIVKNLLTVQTINGKLEEIKSIIDKIGKEKLDTGDKTTIIDAINFLYQKVMAVGGLVTNTQLYNEIEKLKQLLAGGTSQNPITDELISQTYNLSAIYNALQTVSGLVGVAPAGFDGTLFQAVAKLETLLNTSSLLGRLDSMSYIPDYSDGQATLFVSDDWSKNSGLTLNYEVNTTDTDFNPTNYTISALVKPVATRASAGTSVAVSSKSFDSGVLTVSIAASELKKVMTTGQRSFAVAVVVADATGEKFTSTYAPVYVPVNYSAAQADGTTFTMSGSSEKYITNIKVPAGLTVSASSNKTGVCTVSYNEENGSVKISPVGEGTADITVSVKYSGDEYSKHVYHASVGLTTITIKDPAGTDWTKGENNTVNAYYASGHTYTVGLSAAFGNASLSAGWANVAISGDSMTITLTENGGDERSQDFSIKNADGASLSFTIVQPRKQLWLSTAEGSYTNCKYDKGTWYTNNSKDVSVTVLNNFEYTGSYSTGSSRSCTNAKATKIDSNSANVTFTTNKSSGMGKWTSGTAGTTVSASNASVTISMTRDTSL